MRRRRSKAFRPGTQANHRSVAQLYAAFAINFQTPDFPATVSSLLLFAEFLLRSYRAPRSVLNALSSLRTFHLIRGLQTDAFADYQVTLYKRALPLTVRHVPTGAAPLPFDLLERLCALSERQGTGGLAFAALMAATFFSMARLSSLAPPNGGTYDVTRFPIWQDLTLTPDRATLRIKWAKNRQEAGQALVVPLLPLPASPACPVRLFGLLTTQRRGIPLTAPLFGYVGTRGSGGTHTPFFTAPLARGWLSSLLAHLGLPVHAYSFHSFRRGACHLAYGQGASVTEVQALGGWRSDAVACYLPLDAARGRAAATLAAASSPAAL